jgi:hypothetical protein
MLVVDASVVLRACGIARGFEEFRGEELVGPPLMWSEARSVLHELRWRRAVTPENALRTRSRLEGCPVAGAAPLGWGKRRGGWPMSLAGRRPTTQSTWRWLAC